MVTGLAVAMRSLKSLLNWWCWILIIRFLPFQHQKNCLLPYFLQMLPVMKSLKLKKRFFQKIVVWTEKGYSREFCLLLSSPKYIYEESISTYILLECVKKAQLFIDLSIKGRRSPTTRTAVLAYQHGLKQHNFSFTHSFKKFLLLSHLMHVLSIIQFTI